MVTTRSTSGKLPVRKTAEVPHEAPKVIKYVSVPIQNPEQFAAIKERIAAENRVKAAKVEDDLKKNPRKVVIREIPGHVEALENHINNNFIEDFDVVGDAQKGLAQNDLPKHIQHQIGLKVETYDIPKPNAGKNPKQEVIGKTERVTAFVQLTNGSQAQQMYETEIQGDDGDAIGHAVWVVVAPTLKELLMWKGGKLQADYLKLTESA